MTLEDLFEAMTRAPVAPQLPRRSEPLAEAMDWRHHYEQHACLFCGERAVFPVYFHASDLFGAPRWCDCCRRCAAGLQTMVMLDWPDDDAGLFVAWERWQRAR